jgi:4-amino-4-deoxy-L-arabinose transferase-like glycosyltransferase
MRMPWTSVVPPSGLTKSEGHRVIPALEMLDSGQWLVPHMFGQPYLRKPPGGIWAFAGSIRLTGHTELGPRLVSALAFLLLCAAAAWFARRWFGPRAALPAALATALTPILWNPAVSAELESLNNLFAALTAWTALELATRRACRPNLATATLGVFAACLFLVKGPAGLPPVLGLLLGAAWAARSWRPLRAVRPWIGLGLGLAAFAAVWLAIEARVRANAWTPVRQSPSDFMFNADRLGDLAAFLPLVFLAALPAGLAALFPWGPDARAEAARSRETARQHQMARTLTLGAAVAAVILLLTGVSNPRYAQPVIATLGPLAGWGVAAVLTRGKPTAFLPHRKSIGRLLTLGHPLVLATVLALGFILYYNTRIAADRATSGRAPGIAAAQALAPQLLAADAATPGPITVLADGAIEARPELLLAFRDAARAQGVDIEVRWTPNLAQFDMSTPPHAGTWAVLRNDPGGNETPAFEGWTKVHSTPLHEWVFEWWTSTGHPPANTP